MKNTGDKERISILGCGWLGLPLAKDLVKQGYLVRGSVMQEEGLPELQEAGIDAYQIELSPELQNGANTKFFESDILISCIPPKRRKDIVDFYPEQVNALRKQAISAGVKKVLFISSTSVYPNTQGKVRELDRLEPEKDSGRALRLAEDLLIQETAFETTILRLGGLIGYDRHPGRFLSGKKELKNGEVPVNLIHQDDCLGIISELIKQQVWGDVFHACSPEHPTRKEFYQKAAKAAGLPEPQFEAQSAGAYKWVDSSKIVQRLNYQFKFSSPLDTI